MSGRADPKPDRRRRNRPRRIEDPTAVYSALLTYPTCAACGVRAATAHHVIQKGAPHFGDDVAENIVGLCGSGTSRCHGAVHGSPYVVTGRPDDPALPFEDTITQNARRDAYWVSWRIGEHLLERRPDVVEYVLRKLGGDPGRAYLERFYYLALPDHPIDSVAT